MEVHLNTVISLKKNVNRFIPISKNNDKKYKCVGQSVEATKTSGPTSWAFEIVRNNCKCDEKSRWYGNEQVGGMKTKDDPGNKDECVVCFFPPQKSKAPSRFWRTAERGARRTIQSTWKST